MESLLGHHVDRAPARFGFLNEGMVAKTGRCGVVIDIFPDQLFGVVVPFGFVLVSVGVLGVGFEVQKVGPDRAITIFEPAQHDTIFHLGHLGTCHDGQGIR